MFNFDKQRQGDNRRRARRTRPWLDDLEHRVVLSTFKVNTTLDTVAVSLKTGKDASGHISLRSAIMAADAEAKRRHDYRSRGHVQTHARRRGGGCGSDRRPRHHAESDHQG